MVWAAIHHGGRTVLVHVAGAPTSIRYPDEILQHHIIPHVNVYSGRFGVTMPDYMLYMLVSVCSTTMPKHYFGLPVHWI